MERRRRACRHPGVADTTRARGFTLLETMLALTIILVGVLSVLQAQRSFIFTNQWSTHAATASYLASEIRELARSLPRHDRFSGGLYFTTPGNPDTLQGWGPEPGETLIGDLDDLDDLDGAVFGDHCSPISDTTIMSSMATSCDHVDHVRTQLPYAATAAVVCLALGYVPVGLLRVDPWLCLPVVVLATAAVPWVLGRPVEKISKS